MSFHEAQKRQSPFNPRIKRAFEYLGWESNPHSRKNWILNPAYIPSNIHNLYYNQLINKYMILYNVN